MRHPDVTPEVTPRKFTPKFKPGLKLEKDATCWEDGRV